MRIIGIIFLFYGVVYGCTDFVIQTKDRALINGRSLEFAADLETKIKIFPRNMKMISKAPRGKEGLEWTSKYGYLGVTVFNSNLSMDGLNEVGLSFGYLWLPGTEYQIIPSNETQKALDFTDFGDWILGNFSTIAELKKALPQILVWGHPVPPLPGVPPLHLAIHDRLGNHLVIEFIKGEMKVYDNPNTVLTNYPPLDWHLINLQNYIGLTALNSQAVQLKGMDLTGPGQGTGLFGIPGDWTPPSRFVRMTTLLHFAKQANNQMEGVNLAEHLLNAVDIPKGEIIARDGEEDYTQWIVIKDLTNKLFYFRTYDNLCLKMIDLKKLNFNPNAPQKTMGMSFKQGYLDVTSDL